MYQTMCLFIIQGYNEEWQSIESNLSSQADRWEEGPFRVQVICMKVQAVRFFGATMRHQAAHNCTEDYLCLPLRFLPARLQREL